MAALKAAATEHKTVSRRETRPPQNHMRRSDCPVFLSCVGRAFPYGGGFWGTFHSVTPSGRQQTYKNRIHWCLQYLKNAGLIASVARATYTITDRGKQSLIEDADKINLHYLEQFDSFVKFHGRKTEQALSNDIEEFSKAARKYVEDQKTMRIVLVDGTELARLMIDNGVGVSVQQVFKVMQIDNDYFET